MADSKERLIKMASDAELKRRWDLVRAMMREQKIDYLVMQTSEEFLGGTVRWFSDWTARHQFPMTVIFPVDEEMTVINCGVEPPNAQVYPAAVVRPGHQEQLGRRVLPDHELHEHLRREAGREA